MVVVPALSSLEASGYPSGLEPYVKIRSRPPLLIFDAQFASRRWDQRLHQPVSSPRMPFWLLSPLDAFHSSAVRRALDCCEAATIERNEPES